MEKTNNPYRNGLEYLRKHGWVKHTTGGLGRPACLVGGLMWGNGTLRTSSISDHWNYDPLLNKIITEQYPDMAHAVRVYRVTGWNDCHDIRFEDVERVLEKAAIQYDEEVG